MIFVDNKERKYLPYSGRRYVVCRSGQVYDREGNKLPQLIDTAGTKVELAWLNGVDTYLVGMLVIVTFCPMYLPEHLWINIEPLYLDEDPTNNDVENLSYRFFGGQLPYEGALGFCYIPHFTKYVIDRCGIMLTAENGREKTWTYVKPDLTRNSKGGYRYTRVVNVPGVNGVLLRHRALCYTFKPVTKASDYELLVNHLDGIPGNDKLDNLEWATYSQNNQHAHDNNLTGRIRNKVQVKDLRTNSITEYPDTRAAATALGHGGTHQIRFRLRHAPTVLYDDYLQFKWDDKTEWLPIDQSVKPVSCKVGTKMASLNVFTGELLTFDTFEEGAAKTGVDKQTIAIHVRDKQVIPFMGYNFSWYVEGMEWPRHGETNLLAYRKYPTRTPDPVQVTDLTTGEMVIFESRNELSDFLDISPSYATQLVSNGLVYQNRYKTEYLKLRENITVPLSWKV